MRSGTPACTFFASAIPHQHIPQSTWLPSSPSLPTRLPRTPPLPGLFVLLGVAAAALVFLLATLVAPFIAPVHCVVAKGAVVRLAQVFSSNSEAQLDSPLFKNVLSTRLLPNTMLPISRPSTGWILNSMLSNIMPLTSRLPWPPTGQSPNTMPKRHINASFTVEKFFAAFNFLEDYLVVPFSNDRGRWYANAVWTGMIIRARGFLLKRSRASRWSQFSDALATIALSDHYDDIKITDFSQISHVYRLQKKQLRQNSEAVRRNISPVDPMPEEAPIPSLTRVIEAETWANSEA